MPTKRRIVIGDLDDVSRSVVQECLPSDHFQLVEFRENEPLVATGHVDLVVFRAAKEKDQIMEICATLRSSVGLGAPLMACVGMYDYAVVRPLLGNVVRSIIIAPFNTTEFRKKLDELDMGF